MFLIVWLLYRDNQKIQENYGKFSFRIILAFKNNVGHAFYKKDHCGPACLSLWQKNMMSKLQED